MPQAIIFANLLTSHEFTSCKLLTYDFPWTRQHLALLGVPPSSIRHHKPTSLHYACRVLVPSPSHLDAPTLPQLAALRRAVLPRAAPAALSGLAAMGASVGEETALLLLQIRQGEAGSVHGEGRGLTNLPQLVEALNAAARRWRGHGNSRQRMEVSLSPWNGCGCAYVVLPLRRHQRSVLL